MDKGRYEETDKGLVQGGSISPLCSNIMLNELDRELERRGIKFVRYSDDMQLFAKTKRSAKKMLEHILPFIEKKPLEDREYALEPGLSQKFRYPRRKAIQSILPALCIASSRITSQMLTSVFLPLLKKANERISFFPQNYLLTPPTGYPYLSNIYWQAQV